MRFYIDASVVLRHVLARGRPPRVKNPWGTAHSSMLLRVEGSRALDRARTADLWNPSELAGASEAFRKCLDEIEEIPISEKVLWRASLPYPEPLGALDAIHLASAIVIAERLGEPVHFLTHDRRLGLAARAAGLEASGFLEKG